MGQIWDGGSAGVCVILKTNSVGVEQWRHTVGVANGLNLLYEGIEVNGTYIVAGRKTNAKWRQRRCMAGIP